MDSKVERKVREESHASTNNCLPEEDTEDKSGKEHEGEQEGTGLEEKEMDHHSEWETGDERGQGEEIGRSSEEGTYLGSAQEDDSE